LSAGIVARMRSKSEPTVSSFQFAMKSVPASAAPCRCRQLRIVAGRALHPVGIGAALDLRVGADAVVRRLALRRERRRGERGGGKKDEAGVFIMSSILLNHR